MIGTALEVGLAIAAAPVVAASAYLLALTALSGRRPAPHHPPSRRRFDVVVPAHDEEAGIAATVRSLLALDHPPALRRVLVVADNCTDRTAALAREAGALVLERKDEARRGKGHALDFAFRRCLADGVADAVVVVDADTVPPRDLLRAFSARLDAGAVAIQADYGVGNPGASWRSGLTAIGFALVDTLRMIARERLRCSAGLRGNGMCFDVAVLREVPHQAFSIVEDVEYGIRLGLAGHRVHYAGEVTVLSDMPSTAGAAGVQRRRWERGRRALARRHALRLMGLGLWRRDRVLFDLGADLAVPPLAGLAAAATAGAAVSWLSTPWLGRPPAALWAFLASLAALAAYVLRGWWLSGTGLAGLRALAFAPAYLLWKVSLLASWRPGGADRWVRTPREGRQP